MYSVSVYISTCDKIRYQAVNGIWDVGQKYLLNINLHNLKWENLRAVTGPVLEGLTKKYSSYLHFSCVYKLAPYKISLVKDLSS